MSQDDLEAQLQALRQTLTETHKQLTSNPSLTPEMIEEMLAPLHRQVVALEAQIQATRFDLRDQRFEQQVIVAGDYVDQRPVTPQPTFRPQPPNAPSMSQEKRHASWFSRPRLLLHKLAQHGSRWTGAGADYRDRSESRRSIDAGQAGRRCVGDED